MAIRELLRSMSALVAKHVSRAAKNLRRHRPSFPKLPSGSALLLSPRGRFLAPSRRFFAPLLDGAKKRLACGSKKRKAYSPEDRDLDDGGASVWRRTILMGEKCQPLDFSGVIYYDSEGKQLSEIPAPRSPLRSQTPPSFGFEPVATAGGGRKEWQVGN